MAREGWTFGRRSRAPRVEGEHRRERLTASANARKLANEMTDAFVSSFFTHRSPVRLLSSFKAAMRARRRSSSRTSMTAALRARTATRSSAASPRSRARYETRRDYIHERFNADGCQSTPVDGRRHSSFDARAPMTKTLEDAPSEELARRLRDGWNAITNLLLMSRRYNQTGDQEDV